MEGTGQRIPAWIDGALRPADKIEVHRRGLKHRAVSVFVVDGSKTLIQKRAAGKYHTPGLWANACCTHPLWGETPAACARRRLRQELGIEAPVTEYRGQVEYRADVGGGMTEHEVVDLFVARTSGPVELDPDPAEVADTRWIGWDALAEEIRANPAGFTPWLRIYLSRHGALLGLDGSGATVPEEPPASPLR